MNYKKLVSCIYIRNGKAVKSLKEDTILEESPLELAIKYSNFGADEIIVFDFSNTDVEHEESLSIIKEIGRVVDIPMIGAGNVKRLEDVKKLIYAGCRRCALNFSKEGNIALTEEASKRFGKNKIVACVDQSSQLYENDNLIKNSVCEILYVGETDLKECCNWIETSCKGNANPYPLELVPIIYKKSLHEMAAVLRSYEIVGIAGLAIDENPEEYMTFKYQCKNLGISMNTFESSMKWSEFKLNSDGMIPVIVQDYKTSEVLMMAYMNEEAYQKTVETGIMTYFSRSRQELWKKGETSGHYQYVKSLTADCDVDTILAKVLQVGAACHTGSKSCFFNQLVKKEYDETNPLKVFEDVYQVIMDRKEHPKEGSYTNYLFDKGIDKILKKVGEECTEIIIAAKNPDPEEIKYEMSDFLYHAMVLMAVKDVTWEDVTKELAQR
ncbi:MAG: bifunctional phosphoribosyl-AMP cyclohydrolase/phosphoribosyl-ATP diphosphatase HisIE [Lachnospiraceae bacterium]|nr:bifunctional phosphoribosyl-AMP cyclohydrolase/phosphoribosyl-ATP diphosphatase HisIE [Lachnospiraceae bacterium]